MTSPIGVIDLGTGRNPSLRHEDLGEEEDTGRKFELNRECT